MTPEDQKPVENPLAGPTEAEALASLRQYALGPISAQFTWSEASVILGLLDTLTRSGVVEVAVRNPSVSDYMKHWEARAEAAEAKVKVLTEALRPFASYADNNHKFSDSDHIGWSSPPALNLMHGHFRAAARALETNKPEVCSTCGGSGEVDKRLGGEPFGGIVPCPDCALETNNG